MGKVERVEQNLWWKPKILAVSFSRKVPTRRIVGQSRIVEIASHSGGAGLRDSQLKLRLPSRFSILMQTFQ